MSYNPTDRALKILVNKQETSSSKALFEEFGDSTININAEESWFSQITYNSPSSSTASGVALYYDKLVLANDNTVASFQSYFASSVTSDTSTNSSSRLKNWISDKYGDNYAVSLFDNANTQIFPTDALGWFFDYPTGILTMTGNATSFSRPFKLSGWRFIGQSVYSTITSLSASLSSAGGSVDYSVLNQYYVSLSASQTISGNKSFLNNVSLSATPSLSQHLITKGYLDGVSGSFGLPLATLNTYFVSLTADQTVSGNKSFLNNVSLSATPSLAQHLITKGYLDGVSSAFGLPLATLNTYFVSLTADQTVSGFKSFLNSITLSVTPTADNHAVTLGILKSSTASLFSTTTSASSNLNSQINTVSGNLYLYTNTVSSNLNSNLSNYVHLITDQTISGNKSFLNNIVLSATPSANNHLVTFGYVGTVSSNLNSQITTVSGNLFSYINSNTASLFSTTTSASANLNSQINTVSGNLYLYVNTVSSNLNVNLTNYVHLITDQTVSGNKSFLNNVSLSATPSLSQHLITKGYLDGVSSSFGLPLATLNTYFVSLTADQTISGNKSFLNNISLSATPSLAQHVITKGYLDSVSAQFVSSGNTGSSTDLSTLSSVYVSLTATQSVSGIKTFTDTISGNFQYRSITGTLIGNINYINLSASTTAATVFFSTTGSVTVGQVIVINNANNDPTNLYNTDHVVLSVSPTASTTSFTIASVYASLVSLTGGYVSTTGSTDLINFGMSGSSIYSLKKTNYRSAFLNVPIYMFDPNIKTLGDVWAVKDPITSFLVVKIQGDDGIYGVEFGKL